MARTPSTMQELGTPAPDFNLLEPLTGERRSLADFRDAPALLVVFMCNHCPYVIHIRDALAKFAREYQPRGLAMVGINANDVDNYPADSPEKMVEEIKTAGYTFPYLYDEDQSVAKAYHAACTPDFFLYDADRKLFYRGQFDDSRPRNDLPVTGRDLAAAVEAVLAGKPAPAEQIPSLGCNIKWKPGNEPD
ncbi:MAG TPA: thioredoxin family protein, partial [Gammaproteobacteria bacterium]|nr:thioredoxin family protein [Gammaproteobacteria bacterium]